jgi:hypothetical protein
VSGARERTDQPDPPVRIDRRLLAALFILALTARTAMVLVRLHHGDIGGGYDPSVYYTASAALLHGRMPYTGDFVFLHPPLVILVGLPFALLGHLTTDFTGYVAANVAFAVLGALTAVLVAIVAARHGLSRAAVLSAGVFFATWSVTVAFGSFLRLEPLGDALLALALLPLARRQPSRRALVVAGVVLGALLLVKLWWVAPVAVRLVETGVRARRWCAVLVPGVVAAGTAALLILPFAVAGHRIVHSLLTAQLDRPSEQGVPTGGYERISTMQRLADVTGARQVVERFLDPAAAFHSAALRLVTVLACALALATVALALRTALGRAVAPLLAVQVAVLLTAPFFFGYYAELISVAFALTVGAAVSAVLTRARGRSRVRRLRRGFAVATWPALGVASTVLMASTPALSYPGSTPDWHALADSVRGVRCVQTDTPSTLIRTDLLDRTLTHGCRNWVDLQGVAHGAGPDPSASVTLGRANPAWRRDVVRYLTSGGAVLLADPGIRHLLGPARYAQVTGGQLLLHTGPVRGYGVLEAGS